MITVLDSNHKKIIKIFDAEYISAGKTDKGLKIIIKPRTTIEIPNGVFVELT